MTEPVFTSEEYMRASRIGPLRRQPGPIVLVDYDAAWPALFEREAERVRAVLGDRVLRIEHAGSTSVPGLCAKPIVDIVLVVADSSDEPAYVPRLEKVPSLQRPICTREQSASLHSGSGTTYSTMPTPRLPSCARSSLALRRWPRAEPNACHAAVSIV